MSGVQKFHARVVPRIGGVGIMAGMVAIAGWLFVSGNRDARVVSLLIGVSLPAFLGGFIEDCTKVVSAKIRLALTMLAAALGWFLLGAGVLRLDIPLLDAAMLLAPVSLLFTMVAVGGVANAVNIVDGFNGLASMVCVLMLAALGYVGFLVGDTLIWRTALAMMGAILGFFIWNWPKGLIFLGDGGAYFLGFMLAELAVLLVARNQAVSSWFPLLVLIYPIFETVFSIWRRTVLRGTAAHMPDAAHMHSLVYKRVVRWVVGSRAAKDKTARNAMTSPYLWLLCSISVIPAMLFWQNTLVLQVCTGAFIVLYIILYRRFVLFNTPHWLQIRRAHRPRRKKENNKPGL